MPTTFDAGAVTLERVRDNVWEIPQQGDMRVPARVLASEALLEEIAEDKTLEQLRNTTHLPGIQKYAVCMPDGHQGYGFPVGGVAGIDADSGCISPGAVGYDINCLSGDSSVHLSFGRRLPISDLEDRFEDERVRIASREETESRLRLFTKDDDKEIFEVTTRTGRTVRATKDHPFRTPTGMTELEELEPGQEVHVQPFQGIEHEDPEEFVVLDQSDFDSEELVASLEANSLLPLTSTDEALARLLKLVGFHTGNGSFRGSRTWFHADAADLETLREDIAELGYTPSRIYERDRDADFDDKTVSRTQSGIQIDERSFKVLLMKLGAPDTPRVESDFTIPEYIERLPDWQRALYLSGFFGAELAGPAPTERKNMSCLKLFHNRRSDVAESGERFLQQIRDLLGDLDVETTRIERIQDDAAAGTVRLRLGLKNDPDNLLRFLEQVGYCYNRDKRRKAAKAIQYLRLTQTASCDRTLLAEATPNGARGISANLATVEFDNGDRSVEPSLTGGEKTPSHPPDVLPDYEEFCRDCEVSEDFTVTSRVASIESVGSEAVYDIGVAHDAHNFLANGFVVSNCGVRMMKTNLEYEDIQNREEELVDQLFANIPTGLGGGGVYEGSVRDVNEILDRGMEWALEQGFAVQDDLEHCEDEGLRPDSDPDAVSQKAKNRGQNQIGSLGSGNHFLEVQRVTDIYREDVAADFGLSADQVVILIHCGSRGLGHQVCTDYLREIEQTHAGLLDQLPDKELAAAPAGSRLADQYYGAMCAAINFAWVNRQLIMQQTRQVFEKVFDTDWETLGMYLLYDVAHNIAKRETHTLGVDEHGVSVPEEDAVDHEQRSLYVHRKGATRAFPAGRPELPAAYRDVGQPIIIPGSMGAGSYVLRGGDQSLTETFGSTAHGAGRLMSRTQAKQEYWGEDVMDDLREQRRVYVKAQSGATVAEEAPGVYKDVDEVVRVSDALGIGDRVARTFPVCNIKG